MRDSKYLLPDNAETIKATEILAKEGFVVMPYMYPALLVARDLQMPELQLLCHLPTDRNKQGAPPQRIYQNPDR